MTVKSALLLAAALLLPSALPAQNAEPTSKVLIRAMLHDPVNPAAELYFLDDAGQYVKLNLVPANLSAPQTAVPVGGSLVFHKTAAVNSKNPQATVAAAVKIAPNIRKAIVIVVSAGPEANPPYRLVVIDDSPAGFGKGECRALNLVTVETAIEAGEHKVGVKPGAMGVIPVVKKINDFNMAQTNFYYKDGERWTPFSERQLQYLPEFRRIFVIHTTPGATQPIVSTIVDTTVAAPPAAPAAN